MPQTTLTPARGSSRRDRTRRQLGDDLGQGEGEVLGQVRTRGVTARARSDVTSRWSAAPVSGPSRRPTLADVDARVAVQAEDPVARRRARRRSSRLSAPPGMTSSAGWKSSRTRPGSSPAACTSASASAAPTQGGGVHVVAAGVGDARRRCWPTGPRWCRAPGGRRGRRAAPRAVPSAPRSATRPAVGQPGDPPAAPARSARRPGSVVRASAQDSSGWACRSRRSSTSSLSQRATTASMSAAARATSPCAGSAAERAVGSVGSRVASRSRLAHSSYAARMPVGGDRGRQLAGQHRGAHLVADRADRRASGAAAGRARRGPAPR